MGLEVVLVCAFLCMLQFNSGNTECHKLQFRVPTSSINGGLQNTQFNPNCPYPLARNGNNICKSCRGSICTSNCMSNNPIRFRSPQNALVVSVPSDKSPSGRLTITIDTRNQSPSNKAAPNVKPANNDETSNQKVDVYVKFVPKNQTGNNPSTFTSGKSNATSFENGERLAANTDGIIDIPNSDQALNVSVIVNSESTGQAPRKTLLTSNIMADNGNGKVSTTHTEAAVNRKPKNATPVDNSSDTLSPTPTPTDAPAPSVGSDSPASRSEPDQSAPVDSEPEPMPTDRQNSGDTKNPKPEDSGSGSPQTSNDKPEDSDSGSPPSSNNKPNASSGTASRAVADDKTAAAGSESGATANSG